MNSYKIPAGPITYEQWLLNRIAHPGLVCGPDVIDDRRWWQHLPGLNPYADLEAQARDAENDPTRQADPSAAAESQSELEPG